MGKIVNKVKVVKAFPGFEVGDILTLDNATGLFEYNYEHTTGTGTNDLLDAVDRVFISYHSAVSKSVVLANLGEYFIDLSEYVMQPTERIEARIAELYKSIEEAKAELTELGNIEYKEENEEYEGELDSMIIDLEESITVWQNMAWFGEWVLGKRTTI